MSSFAIASVVFGCSFGAALIGMVLHIKLPDHHLDSDSRDVVKLVMGLIATMSALVLSLLIASANSSYDRESSELKALSINILLLDRTLKFYGPGAKEARDGLRDARNVPTKAEMRGSRPLAFAEGRVRRITTAAISNKNAIVDSCIAA